MNSDFRKFTSQTENILETIINLFINENLNPNLLK